MGDCPQLGKLGIDLRNTCRGLRARAGVCLPPGLPTPALGDQAPAKADGHCMRARARLEFREQMADVRLHRLLGQEEAVPDLAVHQAFADELEDFDLSVGGLLLELLQRSGKGDDLAASALACTTCRDRVEAARVVDVAIQDLLTLGSVHDGLPIGAPPKRL
jgi:hypothetical protein